MINTNLLEILACPVCKSGIDYIKVAENEYLFCKKCNLYYPIKEDIPILLPQEAVKEEDVKRD